MRAYASKIARRLLAAGLLLFQATAFAGIVAYWRFEDISGPYAAEQTGRFTGELTGFYYLDPESGDSGPTLEGWSTNVASSTIPQTGQPNNGSIRMQGGGAFVDFSNGQNMYLGTHFTIEFFMKPDYPIISVAFGLSPFSALSMMMSDTLGTPYFNLHFMNEMPYAPATSVQFGQWQHFALVKQPGQYAIYIDGILAVNDTLPGFTDGPYFFPGTDNTGDRTIGGNSGTFCGWLDEFRIYDTALTPDQFLIVPEPSTVMLIVIGCLGLYGCHWRTRNRP